MAGNPFFSGRIPKELNDSIVKHCEETGKSKTDVLIAALSNYLNIPIPESNSKGSTEITKEMYEDIVNRLEQLEDKLNKKNVITDDNRNKKGIVVTVIPQNINSTINKNNADSNAHIVVEEIKKEDLSKDTNRSKYQYKSKEITPDNNDNKNVNFLEQIAYKGIKFKELSEIASTTANENKNLKNQAFSKAEKKGYEIAKNVNFNPPIETILRRGIFINGQEYKLYCEGIDKDEKPIWSLEPHDNASYQPDILKMTN